MICKFVRTVRAVVLLALGLSACATATPRAVPGDPLPVLTTISTFNSFVEGVGGRRVAVSSLVPVGVSPEDYQPTPADIARLHDARMLVENGLGLETWLGRTIENARNPGLRVVVASAGLPVKDHNPHLWMDPELARGYVRTIRDALTGIDATDARLFARNARAFDGRLVALEHEIARRIATIPPESRAMIVFHNAWQYYDDRFGLRTIGAVELSPGQEPSPSYVSGLVRLAKANHVRAVFAEPEYSPKLVQTLAESAGIRTVANLYDDSIGSDSRVHDYISMLRYDSGVIAQALGGR
jgi:zinc/manganese transport system substrate-binding protein/manganese/iron transport system substrate-binding protein